MSENKTNRIELKASNGEHKVYTGFEPRNEGEGIEFKTDNKWYEEMDGTHSIDLRNSDIVNSEPFAPRVEGEPPTDEVYEWWKIPTPGHLEGIPQKGKRVPEYFEVKETVGAATIAEGTYSGPFNLVESPIEFTSPYKWEVDVDNINNMNDVRHIFRLLDIKLSDEWARKLPLHLVKPIENK